MSITLTAQAQQIVLLYEPNQIPYAKGNTEIPRLTVYTPQKVEPNGIGVIVCSGGAYRGRANTGEGIPAAKKLAEAGVSAFLLDYRVPDSTRMEKKELVPLMDAQQAILYVRTHAAQYKLDSSKIGIMGFSAGGHLVSTVGTHFTETLVSNPENISLRPDFLVLVYPVISFADTLTHIGSRQNLIGPDYSADRIKKYSNELQVTDNTPPAYIVSAVDDDIVKVNNSLYFEAAMRQHKVPVEMFLYVQGGHGFGIDNETAKVQWIDDCIDWIKKEKWRGK
jgi:acetyl esterase/lipase